MSKYINVRDTKLELSQFLLCEKESESATWEEIAQVIDRMDSADVRENIHGMWEERFDYPHEKFCSRCGIPQLWMNAVVYNYCPNCGADMRERKESK